MAKFLTYSELFQIPRILMPMPVLSDNIRSWISGAIKGHTKGFYGHFMWLIDYDTLASQGPTGFKRYSIGDYAKCNRLKIFYNVSWDVKTRDNVRRAIESDLRKPWYRQRYDFMAYIGQLTGIRAIQSPWADICSEKARYIPGFSLKNPSTTEVNEWLERSPDFRVYGRYTPD